MSSNRRAPAAVEAKRLRRARTLKVSKKTHTGEVVETKGGNHKPLRLKEWKAEHGSATVESWLTKRSWFEYKKGPFEGPFH